MASVHRGRMGRGHQHTILPNFPIKKTWKLVRKRTPYGLFILHGNRTGTGTASDTGTIGNNGSWSLSLSRTSVDISTWYCTFHLVHVLVPVLFPCSVTKPLDLTNDILRRVPFRAHTTDVLKYKSSPLSCSLFSSRYWFDNTRPCRILTSCQIIASIVRFKRIHTSYTSIKI